MSNKETLLVIKQKLDSFADEYKQIVNVFDKSTMNTEHLAEEKKMKIRMNALEIRCKNSQFLLENVITALNAEDKEINQVAECKNTVSDLLSSVRNELNKNNLLEMIKHLEKIPVVMSIVDNSIGNKIRIATEIDSKSLH
ncbi:MAG: hypothetical protein HFP81_07295 [Methylococcales symbiont of Hymedesmia sp. n. MRB-2018]|nr:MAG: hypothetical protein HFP78_07565 [Methylococcales symbiont of Hymedesmia sp. n. MRB-2018]KAF3983473.1 MAG: hypothetical protein HFP81_07295 [Methylococcales symbiont of Hymedesmia sp. n. MRB-2018]